MCKHCIPSETGSSSSTSSLSYPSSYRPFLATSWCGQLQAFDFAVTQSTLSTVFLNFAAISVYTAQSLSVSFQLSTRCIQFCLFSSIFFRNNCILTFFVLLKLLSVELPSTVLNCLISTDWFLFSSLANCPKIHFHISTKFIVVS